jgi:DNA-binding NarL/FixJ family response regulator
MIKKERKKTYTVVIVDDHEIFRQGLKTLIKGFDQLTVIGSLTDGKQLVAFLEKQVPDIIIMDIHMPYVDGIAASIYVKEYFPKVKIIALTMYNDSYTIDSAFKAGASAFLTKAITKKTFYEAITHVLADMIYISADAAINYSISQLEAKDLTPEDKEVAKKVRNAINNKPEDIDLSDREIEIVRYISKGLTSTEIAHILNLSRRSIDTFRLRMMKKMKVKNATELVKLLIEKGAL